MASKKSDLAKQSFLSGLASSVATEEVEPAKQQDDDAGHQSWYFSPPSVTKLGQYRSARLQVLMLPGLLDELKKLAKTATDPDLKQSKKKKKSLSVNKTIECLLLLGLHQVAQWQKEQGEKSVLSQELMEQLEEIVTSKNVCV